jgi:hypothetical protein
VPRPPVSKQQHEQQRALLDRIAARYEQLEARLSELESQIGEGPAVPCLLAGQAADQSEVPPVDPQVNEPSKAKRPRKPR